MIIKDYFSKVMISISQFGLVLLVPLLLHMESHTKQDSDTIIFKGEVIAKLKEKGLHNKFASHKMKCSECNSPVHFDNLGLVVTQEKELKLYCRDPGCALKA
jgi:hypothetical protein